MHVYLIDLLIGDIAGHVRFTMTEKHIMLSFDSGGFGLAQRRLLRRKSRRILAFENFDPMQLQQNKTIFLRELNLEPAESARCLHSGQRAGIRVC